LPEIELKGKKGKGKKGTGAKAPAADKLPEVAVTTG